jgi:hypothetical protein
MALKDMKSDLSKFRMPKKELLENKASVVIKDNTNKTPLDSLADGLPNPTKSKKINEKVGVNVNPTNKTPITTNKEGVNPQKVNQTEKFKGETTPKPMNNSEQFLGETSPTPMDSSEKFLGETTPQQMDSSEKFLGETNPKPMSLEERFLGETETNPITQGDKFKGETEPTKTNTDEKFLGETTPDKMNNSEQFLGETTPKSKDNTGQFLGETNPKPMSLEERYLGETTPTDKDSTGQFLGETNPNIVQQGDKFKGETTTESVSQGDKFKGETDPTKFDNTSNFVRFSNEKISSPFSTEPNQMNLDAKFLGETDPNVISLESKFLGETTPTDKDSTGQFLGETTPSEMGEQTGDKFLGETTPNVTTLGDKFKGETTPSNFPYILRQETQGKEPGKVNYIEDLHANGFTSNMYPIGGPKKSSQFIGVDPSQTQFDGATSLYGTLGLTNFIVDDDAAGFTKDMFPIGSSKKPSQFIGVDTAGTIFDEKASDYSNTKSLYEGLSYRPGYGKFKFDKETGNVQRYSESNKYLIDNELTRLGISQLQEMRSSPSFLDEMYHKFNLRDDAFNLGTAAFAHPLILRGIQRKKISKGEPQKWGFGFPIDDGLVRGGIVTALDRAVVDAVRLGKWMVSVQGLLWGIKNLGLQQATANVESITGKRKTKIWTPINTLAATLGGFAGLHPNRHGITPFDLTKGTYSEVLDAKRNTHTDDIKLANGPTSNRLVNKWNKEFEQLPNGDVKDKGDGSKLLDKLKNAFRGGPNSLYGLGDFAPNQSTENTIPDAQPITFRTYNQKKQYNPNAAGPNASGKKGAAFEPDDTVLGLNANNLPGSFLNNEIKTDGKSHKIELLSDKTDKIKNYETIAYGKIPERNPDLKTMDFRSLLTGDEKTRANNQFTDYENKNIHTRVKFPHYRAGRDLTNHSDGITADPITSAPIGGGTVNDLVKLIISGEGQKVQFRGTAKGITETFSPSWDATKYNGRADQAYMMTTFERSLSFNFQVYATSRDDMIPMYQKLQLLGTMTMPSSYGSNGYQGTLTRLTLGDLYKNKISFIESLSYTAPDELPWDINMDGQVGELPMGIDVSIGFKLLGNSRPQLGASIYGV